MAMTIDFAPFRDQFGDPEKEKRGALATVDLISALPCETQQHFEQLAKITQSIKTQAKGYEEKRTTLTKPLLAAKREVDSWFKPVIDCYAECERLLKSKMVAYQQRQEQARVAQLHAVRDAHQQGNLETAITLATSAPQRAEAAGVSFVRSWRWRVVDDAAVPRELLVVDPAAVRQEIARQCQDGTPRIAGLELYQETDARVRT